MSRRVLSLAMILVFSIVVAALPASAEQGTVFSDVSKDNWAFEAISWGAQHKVVNGFPDRTFAPGKAVTEAEFLKLLISAFEDLPDNGTKGKWYSKYYAFAYDKNWFLKGFADPEAPEKPVLRKNAAILLSAAMGAYYANDDALSAEAAIRDLYSRGVSNGKTDKTIEGFKPDDTLTRAEAVQFIYQFVQKAGLTSLKTVVSEDDWAALDKVTFDPNNPGEYLKLARE